MSEPPVLAETAAETARGRRSNPVVRAAVDYLGLAAFAVAFFASGKSFIVATWALVAGCAFALAVGLVVERRIAPLPALAGVAALIAGLLTLAFKDPVFVKMKPTVVNSILGLGLLAGLAAGKNPLKLLLGEALHLTDSGWRKLTVRYGLFFLVLAALNEVVWRTQSNETWVIFRMPGLPLLALAFSLAQVPVMLKEAKGLEAAARTVETQGD